MCPMTTDFGKTTIYLLKRRLQTLDIHGSSRPADSRAYPNRIRNDGFHGASSDKLHSFSFLNGFFICHSFISVCFFFASSPCSSDAHLSIRISTRFTCTLLCFNAAFMISWRHWKNIVRINLYIE